VPLLDLQRRMRELGRIRAGERKGNRPAKLETFRLTSSSKELIEAAAERYGSDSRGVREWTNPFDQAREYEAVLSTDTLPILVPPGQSLSQWWELWTAAGCERRCDGQREMLQDRACVCPAAGKQRRDLAAQGKACKPTTRLNVVLPELPDVGVWRLESHGFYAAVELAGTADLLEAATRRGILIPASLRLDQRTQKRPGEAVRKYAVPVIDLPRGSAELVLAAAQESGPPRLNGGEPAEAVPQLTTGPTVPHEPPRPALPADTAFSPPKPAEPATPGCAHPADQHQATEQGIVCRACGVLLAARAVQPVARRRRANQASGQEDGGAGDEPAKGSQPSPAPATEQPSDGERETDLARVVAKPARTRRRAKPEQEAAPSPAVASRSGTYHEAKRVHAAASKKGIEHDDLREIGAALYGVARDELASFSLSAFEEPQWRALGELVDSLPADGEQVLLWVGQQAIAAGIHGDDPEYPWDAMDPLALAAFGKNPEKLTVGEWVAWAVRARNGEYAPVGATK